MNFLNIPYFVYHFRKEKTVEVYQQQITCMMRFKHEVLQLKYTVSIVIHQGSHMLEKYLNIQTVLKSP